jgi:hypothetical protein
MGGEEREGQSASAEQRQATIEHASGKAPEALGGRWVQWAVVGVCTPCLQTLPPLLGRSRGVRLVRLIWAMQRPSIQPAPSTPSRSRPAHPCTRPAHPCREHKVAASLEGSLETAREVGQGLGAKAAQAARDARDAVRGAYNAAADKLPEPPGRG